MTKKIKWIIFFLTIIFCVPFINKMLPSFEYIELHDYKNIDNKNIIAAIEDKYELKNFPVIYNEQIYLPVELVHDYIDKYIFWDEKKDKLIITTESKVIRMQTDSLNYYINDHKTKLNLPVQKIDSKIYIPEDFIKSIYPVDISYDSKNKILLINLKEKSHLTAKIKNKTNLRYEPDKKSCITDRLSKNETVFVFDNKNKNNKYTKVRSQSGLIGYMLTKNLDEIKEIPAQKIPATKPKNTKKISGKIKMVWEQLLNQTANYNATLKKIPETINVISPTWFSFDSKKLNGDIINNASVNYVNNAHKNNCQVWALITDNFDYDINHSIFSDTEKREHVIKQLLAYVSLYNLDGINIDFEAVRKNDAKYYIQFLRELAPLLHEQGAILSVDLFVPTNWSLYYNRTEVGKIVDYVCIMAYDEHTKNSEAPGPVASYNFVNNGIKNTLKEVSKEKIILGIPFYVRVWRETGDGFTIKNYSMDQAYKIFEKNNVKFNWLEDKKYYYGEYQTIENSESVTYKTWLEDENSIKQKLILAKKYNLAGISGWKKNLEKDIIWELINQYIK